MKTNLILSMILCFGALITRVAVQAADKKDRLFICRSSTSDMRYVLNMDKKVLKSYLKTEETPYTQVNEVKDIKIAFNKKTSEVTLSKNKFKVSVEIETKDGQVFQAATEDEDNLTCKKNFNFKI